MSDSHHFKPSHNGIKRYSTDPDYALALWKAADALRGQVDAAEYKHVVLLPNEKHRC